MVEYLKSSRTCVIVLVCTTVGELVVLVSLVVHWRIERNKLLAHKQQQLCFPREKFDLIDGNSGCLGGLKEEFKEKENVTVCCGDSSIVLDKVIAKVASDRYNSNINPETSKLNLTEYKCHAAKGKQPVAKLVGLATDRKPVQIGTNFKIIWNSLSPSYALSGLTHLPDDGTIYVKQTGLYYIFSQIKLKLEFPMTETKHAMKHTFRHYIHLMSHYRGTGTTLLENARSQCEMAENESEITSVIGAVFELEKGDRLYVATSHPENLVSDGNNNYFSMHSV